MVAAAKLRRAQERIVAARPCSGALNKMLASVAARVNPEQHALLKEREEKRVLVLVVTSDKGLCGAFNGSVLKATEAAVRERGWEQVQLLPIGRKANDYFRRRTIPIRYHALNVFQALSEAKAKEIAKLVVDDYVEEKIDAVFIIYNEFRSIIAQILHVDKLLPLARVESADTTIDYLYEPSPEEILRNLLPRHIEFQIYRTLLDSAAAEQGARMTAMEGATKNAGEMIDSLTLTYNRIRQAAITKEIIEIVSGAAALD